MFKYRNRNGAKTKADETGLLFGLCVFDGFYYVGTKEQLKAIGCVVAGLGSGKINTYGLSGTAGIGIPSQQ
jgi:hypothetical protein